MMDQADRDAQDAETEKARPAREWMAEIKAYDNLMPRYVEDIIDALDEPIRAKIATETLDKYTLKKEIRLRKPKGD